MKTRDVIVEVVDLELQRAYAKHGKVPWGRHEFYGVLREEVDELWDAIKGDEPMEQVVAETIEVASMCVRFLETSVDPRVLDQVTNQKFKKAVDAIRQNLGVRA